MTLNYTEYSWINYLSTGEIWAANSSKITLNVALRHNNMRFPIWSIYAFLRDTEGSSKSSMMVYIGIVGIVVELSEAQKSMSEKAVPSRLQEVLWIIRGVYILGHHRMITMFMSLIYRRNPLIILSQCMIWNVFYWPAKKNTCTYTGFAITTWNNPKKLEKPCITKGKYLSIFRVDFPM